MIPLDVIAALHLRIVARVREEAHDLHDRRDRLIARGRHGRLLQQRCDDLAKRYDTYRGRYLSACYCRRCTVDYPYTKAAR